MGLGGVLLMMGPGHDLLAGKAAATPVARAGGQALGVSEVAALPNGLYQFCSQPEPDSWPLGAGVCFWFRKVDHQVVGYYGYPHSSHFVDCVKGSVYQNTVTGIAMELPWAGDPWEDIPDTPLTWDQEGFLTLAQGRWVQANVPETGAVEFIQFEQVTLTLDQFYRYSQAKVRQMKQPPQDCRIEQF